MPLSEATRTLALYGRCMAHLPCMTDVPRLTYVPYMQATRARARRALTDCGFVVLDNVIPQATVAKVREAAVRFLYDR